MYRACECDNVTIDNNDGKTFGPAIDWFPRPWLALYANYLGGPERTDNDQDWRHLVDRQLFLGPFDRWNFAVNFDWAQDGDAIAPGDDTSWYGVAGYARYKLNERFEPSLRVEYFEDDDGFATGVVQSLKGVTLILNTMVGAGGSAILLRPELRYDWSSDDFFSDGNTFRDKKDQFTIGVGAVWFF